MCLVYTSSRLRFSNNFSTAAVLIILPCSGLKVFAGACSRILYSSTDMVSVRETGVSVLVHLRCLTGRTFASKPYALNVCHRSTDICVFRTLPMWQGPPSRVWFFRLHLGSMIDSYAVCKLCCVSLSRNLGLCSHRQATIV